MPFDFHNRDRMENLIGELKELRYRRLRDITSFEWYQDNGEIGNREPQGQPETVGTGWRWSGWDRYNWLCTEITVPENMRREDVVGLFDFGVPEGTGNNSHFESLLYVNGEPYQGVDGNHKEVFFPISGTGPKLRLQFRVWSGLNGGGRPKPMEMKLVRAQYGVLDRNTDDFYFLARTGLETYDLLPETSEYKEWLLGSIVSAFNRVDYTEPGSAAFYESIKEAYAYLAGRLQGQGKPDVTVTLLGHTHIDVAWLWRLKHTREKAARSFSTVNRLMERCPEYVFLQSQAQLYEYIKNDYPDIYGHIKKRAAQGRWEPSGSMWVECDCNIASGESIIRQILTGKNFFKEEFGFENTFLWLPDVFGYSWALPQILKKSGIDTFMTTKISWNDTNRLPYDTFLWKGMDGTAVTTHFITTTDEGSSSYTYNGDTRPYAVKGVWDNYGNKDLNRELLISYGYGDGGGGPTRDMIKTAEAVEKMPGIPHVRMGTATEYFNRLEETVKKNPLNGYLPVWDGELYLEFHRGTYTSQAYNKKMNRRMEYRLRDAEILSILAEQTAGTPYGSQALERAWKIVLCQQFHDILPGSAIREVYEDSRAEYEKAAGLLAGVEEKALSVLLKPDEDVFTVFNSANWKRGSYAAIAHESKKAYCYRDQDGRCLPFCSSQEKDYVYLEGMEPFAFEAVYREEYRNAGPGLEAETRSAAAVCEVTGTAETPYYTVCWNRSGQLTGLYDKKARREVLPAGKCGNVIQIFEDKPRCFDAWELEPTIDHKKEELGECEQITVESSPLGCFVTFRWTYHRSTVCQTMCLYQHKKRIDFRTSVDWQEHQKLMKTAFPADIRAVSARYDIQEGNIVRPVTKNTSWEAAKFEVAAHKWADLSETGYGLAVLNDCKYGYDIQEDTVRLTLLKSAVDPDYSADTGTHEFTYALLPHSEEWYEAEIEQEAFDLNNVLTVYPGRPVFGGKSLLRFSEDNIVVDAVKRPGHGTGAVVRFHEFTGARKEIRMETAWKPEKWCLCSLMEEPLGEWREGPVVLEVKPYEIVTVLFAGQEVLQRP